MLSQPKLQQRESELEWREAQLAGVGVVSVKESANAIFTTGDTSDHAVFYDEGRRRLAVSAAMVGHFLVP